MPRINLGVEIEGMDELQAKLDAQVKNGGDRAIRKGLRAGTAVIQAAIIERTPVRVDSESTTALPPGALAADIVVGRVRKYLNGVGYSQSVGPGRATQLVAARVEYGHANKGGSNTPAHPFIRPAFESSQGAAVEALVATIEEQLVEDFEEGA